LDDLRILLSALVAVILVLVGYALGRNSAEKPVVSPETRLPKLKREPTDEPLGDIFNDAMRGDEEARYPTMEEK
jgi:hypothetical protein